MMVITFMTPLTLALDFAGGSGEPNEPYQNRHGWATRLDRLVSEPAQQALCACDDIFGLDCGTTSGFWREADPVWPATA